MKIHGLRRRIRLGSMVFPWYFLGMPVVLPWCFCGAAVVIPCYFRGDAMMLPWDFRGTPVVLPWRFRGSFMFPWYFHGDFGSASSMHGASMERPSGSLAFMATSVVIPWCSTVLFALIKALSFNSEIRDVSMENSVMLHVAPTMLPRGLSCFRDASVGISSCFQVLRWLLRGASLMLRCCCFHSATVVLARKIPGIYLVLRTTKSKYMYP